MATPISLTAGLALGTQAHKGTAASAYVTGLMAMSGQDLKFDATEIKDEHGGTSGREHDAQGARAMRTGYIAPIAGRFRLYPDLIGHALRMMGFLCTSEAKGTVTAQCVQTLVITATGGTYQLTFDGQTTAALAYSADAATVQAAMDALSNLVTADETVATPIAGTRTFTFLVAGAYGNKTPPLIDVYTDALTGGTAVMTMTTPAGGDYYEHVFKLAKRRFMGYGSQLTAIDEGPGLWERKVKDCRLSKLDLVATLAEIMCSYEGLGLTEAAASGSETKVAETAYPLGPGGGSFSILANALQVTGAPREHTLTMTRALADDDKKLHSTTRADLPSRGIDITGQLRGVDATYNIYKQLNWGGTSGTAPSLVIPEAALDWNWVSPANISLGVAFPYYLRVQIPVVQLTLANFRAEGSNLIYFDVDYQMQDIDSSADPITITLRNLKPHYAGS